MHAERTEGLTRQGAQLARRLADSGGTVWLVINSLIVALWLWLYAPLFPYLGIIFSNEDFRTNQILLAGVALLIAARVKREGIQLHVTRPPQPAWLPLALVFCGSLLYLLVERFLDINTVATSLAALATYGLLGLWSPVEGWRRGLPAVVLLVGTLPFGNHLQTFAGYPMRIATAAIVGDGLAALGVSSMGIDTILVFENSVAQVDIPCSGVKSLWTGGLFLIAATWIERRALNARWLGIAALFVLLLFAANVARVAVLVIVGHVLNLPLAAEMLHVPLGVLGFMLACAAAVWLLRRGTAIEDGRSGAGREGMGIELNRWARQRPARLRALPSALWLPLILIISISAMALLYTPRPQSGLGQPPPAWNFPAEMVTEPLPLGPRAEAWLIEDGAESADRHRFEWHGLSGSLILIASHTWRAHHRPERCFEVYGLSQQDTGTHLVNAGFPVRIVSLDEGKGGKLYTASYWLQSAEQTTDDHGTRMWSDLSLRRERWVLVSILFDDNHDPNDPQVNAFYQALHQSVQTTLERGETS